MKSDTFKNNKTILLTFLVGIFLVVLDIVFDTFIFHRGDLLFNLEPSEIWMRGLIIFISTIFGISFHKLKKTDELLKTSEKKYLNLIESAVVGIYITNLQGDILFINEAIVKMLKFNSAEELMKENVLVRYKDKDDREILIEKLKKTGKVDSFESKLLTKTGEAITALVSAVLTGDIITGTLVDITERELAITNLEIALSQLSNILDNLEEVYFSLDVVQQKVLQCSPACEKLFGFPQSAFFNNHMLWMEIVHPEDKQQVYVNQSILAQGKQILYEYRIIRLDGKICWVEAKVNPILNSENKLIRLDGLVSDITERKQLEKEKEKIQQELYQMQKMEAIGTLTGGIAHDFNNLLTVIRGHSELAMMKTKNSEAVYKDLGQINKATLRAIELTQQMLIFSRKQILDTVPLNLNKVINDLLEMITRIIGEDITIKTEFENELGTVQADKGNIEQVILNLTVNARDAMKDGGTILIKTENVVVDEGYKNFNSESYRGNFVCLSVTDSGTGISEDVVKHIFEPFFTTKEVGKGTGLGLAMIYGIVTKHKGWINVYSEIGQGTTFKIYLPAEHTKSENKIEESIPLNISRGNKERILVVEDEEKVRDFVVQVLNENDYAVFEAVDAETAINIFKKEEGNFQLVFTDMVMPGKSGVQLIDNLKLIKPDIKVLFSSGYTKDKSQVEAIKKEGFHFIQKPYSITDLFLAIKKSIQ